MRAWRTYTSSLSGPAPVRDTLATAKSEGVPSFLAVNEAGGSPLNTFGHRDVIQYRAMLALRKTLVRPYPFVTRGPIRPLHADLPVRYTRTYPSVTRGPTRD